MARLPWGGRALAGPRSLSGAISSSPIAARGVDVSRGRRSQKGGVSGRTGVWGHCLGGTSTGSSGELPEGSVIELVLDVPRGPTFPGGGGSERVGRRVGALPGRDEHRLVRGVAGGRFLVSGRGPWAGRYQGCNGPGEGL